MLSILYPAVMRRVHELSQGLIPFSVSADIVPKLIVNVPKEAILTAKLRQEFLIYLIPYELGEVKSVGFVAAFFDDDSNPMVTGGAFIKDLYARQLSSLFLSPQVDVYFFDELGLERLGYRAEFKSTKKHLDLLRSAVFPRLQDINQGAVLKILSEWIRFSNREDDASAISVKLKYSLIPDDLVYIDMRPENNAYHGGDGYRFSTLEREEPGAQQEREIIELMRRVFGDADIYLSPLRTYDGEEVADIIVVTHKSFLVVQAKDSPNIERIVENSIDRKRKTTNKALKKAADQVKGAFGYLKKEEPAVVVIDGVEIEISLAGKNIYGLIVVKELFDDDYDEYSPVLLGVHEKTNAPCIALSFNELHQYTRFLQGDEAFFEAFMVVFNHGIEHGLFPRLRVHPPGSNLK